MSLQSQYLKEREGVETLEIEDKAFVTYKCVGEECRMFDIFVSPDFRRSKIATNLVDQVGSIAKENGCKILIGSVDVRASAATDSVKAHLAYGFKVLKVDGVMIFFAKGIA